MYLAPEADESTEPPAKRKAPSAPEAVDSAQFQRLPAKRHGYRCKM
eukprot:SAG22_NODE_5011_length_1108_cov_1.420218_3_plen_45_part_01